MNKKGTLSQEAGFWIPRLVFLIIAGMLVHTIVSFFVMDEISVLDADAEIFVHRVLNSRDGISYVDPLTNRIYPGIIDLKKFKESRRIEDSIFYGDTSTYIGAKITLKDDKGNKISEQIYKNKAYRRIAEEGMRGAGGVELRKKDIYVLIKEEDNTRKGILHIDVVISRS